MFCWGHRERTDPSDRLTVLGATSGDTGGAAIYGMRGKVGDASVWQCSDAFFKMCVTVI